MKKTTNFLYSVIAVLLGVNVILFFSFSGDVNDNKTSEMQAPEQEKTKEGPYYVVPPSIPKNVSFAGERVPLEYFDVKEGLDREFLVNTYWHSQTLRFLKKAPRDFAIIEPILKKYGVPDDFKYVSLIESGLENVVSPRGAKGYWQIMDRTGKELGLEINHEIDERYSLSKSTEAACKYFLDAHKKFQNWTLAAASYNVGQRGVNKQIDRQDEEDFFDLLMNTETSRYIYRIVSIKTIMENPEKYGFVLSPEEIYPIIPTMTIVLDSAVTDFATYAQSFGTNYKMLKYFNPWLRQKYLKNPRKKAYEIILPTEGARKIAAKEPQPAKDAAPAN